MHEAASPVSPVPRTCAGTLELIGIAVARVHGRTGLRYCRRSRERLAGQPTEAPRLIIVRGPTMTDLSDYELDGTSREPTLTLRSPAHSVGVWIAIVVLIVAAGVAAYVMWAKRARPASVATAAPAVTEAPARSLGGEAEPIAVPPLDESDAVVRQLVRTLSAHPAVAAWLTTDGLIRNFTVVVGNIAEGATPAKHLRPLRPSSPFRVVEPDRTTYVDTRDYDRYTPVADAVASVDAV